MQQTLHGFTNLSSLRSTEEPAGHLRPLTSRLHLTLDVSSWHAPRRCTTRLVAEEISFHRYRQLKPVFTSGALLAGRCCVCLFLPLVVCTGRNMATTAHAHWLWRDVCGSLGSPRPQRHCIDSVQRNQTRLGERGGTGIKIPVNERNN